MQSNRNRNRSKILERLVTEHLEYALKSSGDWCEKSGRIYIAIEFYPVDVKYLPPVEFEMLRVVLYDRWQPYRVLP